MNSKKLNSQNMIETNYISPAMYRILDVADENWGLFSSNEELAELNEHAKTPIDYPELLVEMDQFLKTS